jgi:hypothetical protein
MAQVTELEEHMSQHFICPISHRIMDMPVVSPSGHTYEQASILAWLERRAVDPLSLAPLRATSLYPNRALQEELLEQLHRLAEVDDVHVAAAAQTKLEAIRKVQGERPAQVQADAGQDISRLDMFVGRLTALSTWIGVLAWEQFLVFLTSFGTVLCLSLDTLETIRSRSGAKEARPPLLSSFLRIAALPSVEAPRHWHYFGRLTVSTLRCALLLPVALASNKWSPPYQEGSLTQKMPTLSYVFVCICDCTQRHNKLGLRKSLSSMVASTPGFYQCCGLCRIQAKF